MNDNECIVCDKPLFDNHLKIHKKVRGDVKGKHEIIKCKGCGHIQLFPSYYDFKSHYDADGQNNELIKTLGVSFSDIIEKEVVEAERRYNYINKNIVDLSGKKILDVGGGYCTFAGYCKKQNPSINIKVVEPSKSRSDKGREYHKIKNLEVHNIFVDSDYAKKSQGKYDMVTLWHVLEHVRDIKELLKNLYEMVKKGGYLIMEVPNGNDELSGISGVEGYKDINYMIHHLSYFTEPVLKRILGSAGIKNYKMEYIQRYGFSNYINWAINKTMNFNLRNEIFSQDGAVHWLEKLWIDKKKEKEKHGHYPYDNKETMNF